MKTEKDVSMSIIAMTKNYVRIEFKGYADDDEVEAGKTSNSGPGFYLAFNYDREKIDDVANELIRIGTMLKAIKE